MNILGSPQKRFSPAFIFSNIQASFVQKKKNSSVSGFPRLEIYIRFCFKGLAMARAPESQPRFQAKLPCFHIHSRMAGFFFRAFPVKKMKPSYFQWFAALPGSRPFLLKFS
jgi:hypothetical protein